MTGYPPDIGDTRRRVHGEGEPASPGPASARWPGCPSVAGRLLRPYGIRGGAPYGGTGLPQAPTAPFRYAFWFVTCYDAGAESMMAAATRAGSSTWT